jgi:preprotein translocase subunit SecE
VAARNRRRARDRRARPGQDKSGLATAGDAQTGPKPGLAPVPGAEPIAADAVETPAAQSDGLEQSGEGRDDSGRASRESDGSDGVAEQVGGLHDPPEPLDHAAPDVELADAQIMLGAAGFVRPRDEGSADLDRIYEDEIPEGDADEPALASGGEGGSGGGGGVASGTSPEGSAGGELAHPTAPAVAHPGTFNRLINFLRGSWRELHRVQWPDRRQVMQATGVVLGFVIVAGVYLGVADYISQKVVHFILTR